jgi:hypothetical protein
MVVIGKPELKPLPDREDLGQPGASRLKIGIGSAFLQHTQVGQPAGQQAGSLIKQGS